jgi:hypothetical protein
MYLQNWGTLLSNGSSTKTQLAVGAVLECPGLRIKKFKIMPQNFFTMILRWGVKHFQ